METPTGAKKPQDRKRSAAAELEAQLSEDTVLDGLPELKAPSKLRLRDRNKITMLALRLREFTNDTDEDYSTWTVDTLNAEIDRRNADLEEDERIAPEGRKKDDLISALEADDQAIHLDSDDPRMPLLLDVLADVDEFAESIATDSDAYVQWSLGKGYEVFTALLMRYASAVGESSAS
jgi:hypothetical protein